MPNKRSFFESINHDTIFDEVFFKKVLGYSMYDRTFLRAAASKLISIGRREVVQAYNEWYTAWKANDDFEMKKIAQRYRKEFDRQFESWMRTERERRANECKQRKIELLQQKKVLLLMKKSVQLT